jgi:bifunctional non-homologous end joining protein LigD
MRRAVDPQLLRLPDPMLARTGEIPTTAGWVFEPKLDGFRCLICTHGGRFRARSRRGWEMSERLPELHDALPTDVQLDGELVAWDHTGRPDWHRLSARVLHGDSSIPVTLIAFDVLACEGLPVTGLPYSKRRELLEQLDLERPPSVQVVATFDDGEALFRVVCEQGLEGVVAKRERDPYRPGERDWVKTKNRNTARFAQESARARRGSLLTRSCDIRQSSWHFVSIHLS